MLHEICLPDRLGLCATLNSVVTLEQTGFERHPLLYVMLHIVAARTLYAAPTDDVLCQHV